MRSCIGEGVIYGNGIHPQCCHMLHAFPVVFNLFLKFFLIGKNVYTCTRNTTNYIFDETVEYESGTLRHERRVELNILGNLENDLMNNRSCRVLPGATNYKIYHHHHYNKIYRVNVANISSQMKTVSCG